VDIECSLDGEPLITQMWPPPLYAVAAKDLPLLKQYVKLFEPNLSLCLKEPLFTSEDEVATEGRFINSGLALQLAIQNRDVLMLDYLWNELYFLWDVEDLDTIVDLAYTVDFLDSLGIILSGRAFQNIMLALPFDEQIFFIEKIFFDKFDKHTLFSI